MHTVTFNYLAIISASVTSVVLGGVYIALFKKQWAKLNGFTEMEAEEKRKANPKGLVGIFLANLAMAFSVAYFVAALNITTIAGGVLFGFWVFIGFVGPLSIGPVLWEGKSIKLWVFNNIINIIALLAMIFILIFWK